MITEIETKVVDAMNAAGLGIRDLDVKGKGRGLNYPCAMVATEEGTFTRISNGKYKCSVDVYIIVAFKDAHSEKKRRHGIYPILLGIFQLLMLQNFGLAIDDLVPRGFKNITDKDMVAKDIIAYQLGFATAFTVKMQKEEPADELLRIGLEYYLQDPVDDGEMDAQDLVTLTEEP
jgi:hypothetical protein